MKDLFFEKENISDGASDIGWADAASLGFESTGEGLKLYAPKHVRKRSGANVLRRAVFQVLLVRP